MFRTYAAFDLHLSAEIKRHLPRISYRDTQAIFIALVRQAGQSNQPITVTLDSKPYRLSARLKGGEKLTVGLEPIPR